MTDDRQTTPAADGPPQSATVASPADGHAETPVRRARSEATQRRRRHPAHVGASPVRRGRRGMRLEGRTATSYPLRDEARRTVGYLRLIVGQAHIPDAATVAVDVDRITIEWDD